MNWSDKVEVKVIICSYCGKEKPVKEICACGESIRHELNPVGDDLEELKKKWSKYLDKGE